jgi:hypothetical protein
VRHPERVEDYLGHIARLSSAPAALPRLKQQIDALLNEQQPTLAERFGQPATPEADPVPEQDHECDRDREP